MNIKTHIPKPAIDFNPFMRDLEAKYGFDHRDMAGRRSEETQKKKNAALIQWMNENGYANKAYVLEMPVGSSSDWLRDSQEMADRRAINTGFSFADEPPYLDVWHWLLDNDFADLRRGGRNYINLSNERLSNTNHESWDELPDHVLIVFRAMRTEVEGHECFDGESAVFHVDW